MAHSYHHVEAFLSRILKGKNLSALKCQLSADVSPLSPKIANSNKVGPGFIDKRWSMLGAEGSRDALCSKELASEAHLYQNNIENFIGAVQVPVGIVGPLRVNGMHAKGDHYVPLATTEAALVASYNRGCHAIAESGGCCALVLAEGLTRSPGFVFESALEMAEFAAWAVQQLDAFKAVAGETSRYAQLIDMKIAIEGNHLYLQFEYITGDAAGQNMVTIATQAICDYISGHAPLQPKHYYVEANMSGDKKASMQSFQTVRGKKVTAEVQLSKSIVEKRLRSKPVAMADYWQMSAIGGVMSGTLGVQGHYANGLAALFLATGQDIACVSEASVGVTRMEVSATGDLYASVTLPNLIVGTVGGGTSLPCQAACLEIMGLQGPGKAQAFAEVVASLCLAGELSIIAALSAGHFSHAHKKLARGK